MENGYVLLHRRLFSNKLWLSDKFTKAQAWIDLFANANHTKGSFWVRGNEVKIDRGQIGWSELTMAKRWGWSKNRVRRFLKWLETEQQIKQQKSPLTTVITILNYGLYQTMDKERNSRRYNRKTADDTQTMNDNEELKNDNKEVGEVIASFKEINPSYKKFYANTTQRASVERMLATHGKDRLLHVVSFLKKSNTIPYIPTITSPYVLEEKWADLEAGLTKLKNKSVINQPKVII